MKRLALAVLLVLPFALLAVPLAAAAQPAGKVARVGMLLTLAPEHPQMRALLDPLWQGLHERGHVEGRNIAIEYRWGSLEQFPELAVELVRLKVDLIVVGSTTAALIPADGSSPENPPPKLA